MSDEELSDNYESEDEVEQILSKSNKRKRENEEEDEEENNDNENDEDEEVNNEEEEEEEDEEEEPLIKKRKRNQAAMSFILDEADVDDDEDEEEGEECEEAEAGFEEVEEDEGEPAGREVNRRYDMQWKKDGEEMAEYLQNKFGRKEIDFEANEDLDDMALLPADDDPYLWLLRCRMGEEKMTAISLMKKIISYKENNRPIAVSSVIARDNLRGYLYVESSKLAHVMELIEGVQNLTFVKRDVIMVKRDEMTQVLRVVSENTELKRKQWVRINKGIFKDDLAMIESADHAHNKVMLKLLPRIDYTKKRGVLKEKENENKKQKRFARPLQKPFNKKAIKAIGGEVSLIDDFMIFEGNRYKNGFLFKEFLVSLISTDGPSPSLAEIEKFGEEGAKLTLGSNGITFALGDHVEVIEGGMENLRGKVIKVNSDMVTIQPLLQELQDPLTFQAFELRKYFSVGDNVRIMRGDLEDETGIVMQVGKNGIIILSNSSMTEITVQPVDLQLSKGERTKARDSTGRFSVGDLAHIDAKTVGVIVKIEKEHLILLDMHGKMQKVRSAQLRENKKNKAFFARDADGNSIRVRDVVKVIEGSNKGRQGEVKHVFRTHAFLFSMQHSENNGMFVSKTQHLTLLGASNAASSSVAGGSMITPSMRAPSQNFNKNRGGHSQQHNNQQRNNQGDKQRNDLVGKNVIVIQGPYKTNVGRVKCVIGNIAKVDVRSNYKTISVDVNHIKLFGGQASLFGPRADGALSDVSSLNSSMNGSQTPLYGSHTPMYGSQTPMYGSQTPMYGSQTPMYGSQTPRNGSQTPLYDGSQTPLYGSMTSPHDSVRMTPCSSSAWNPFSPNTPQIDLDYDEKSSKWITLNMEVKLKTSFADKTAVNQHATVKSISGESCTLNLLENERTIVASVDDLDPVAPSRGDDLKIFQGENKNSTGRLLSVDSDEGVVRLDTDAIIMVPINQLCKWHR